MIQATIYKAPSDSGRGNYEVQFYADGTAKCECPAYSFQHRGTCKHIQRLKSQGKGFQAPSVTKVFRLSHEGNEVVVVDDDNFFDNLEEVLDRLSVRKTLTVERLA